MGFQKYIRSIAIVVLFALVSSPLSAQVCTGTAGHFLVWNARDDDHRGQVVYGPIVPPSEVWLVDAAGLFTSDNGWPENTEWMMEAIQPVPEQNGMTDSSDPDRCCHRIPLLKQLSSRATPLAALNRPVVLRPGQRMAGRTNAVGFQFGIDAMYWRFPASCGQSLASGMR